MAWQAAKLMRMVPPITWMWTMRVLMETKNLKRQMDFGDEDPDNKGHQVSIARCPRLAQGNITVFTSIRQAGRARWWALRTVLGRARCAMQRQHRVAW